MKKPIIRNLIFIFCSGIFLFSGWKVYSILMEYHQGESNYASVTERFVSTPAPIKSDNPVITAPPETVGPEEDPSSSPMSPAVYTVEPTSTPGQTPVDTYPIAVDFDKLLEEYPDAVGWITCPDTAIHYPIMQDKDNTYYIHHLPDGKRNSSGSIFLDARCASDFTDWNSTVYGHNMNNGSMFASLKYYKKQDYYDAHPLMYLLTPQKRFIIHLIGGYITSGDNVNKKSFPNSLEARDELIALAKKKSTFQSNVHAKDDEKVITLSTCSYEFDGARYVLVGILRETK